MREILKELDDKITNEDLDMMIEEIDSDGSGTVDFDGNTLFEQKNSYISINGIFSSQNSWKSWLAEMIKNI